MRPCRDLCRSKVPALLTVLHPSGHASHCLEGFVPFQPANASLRRFAPSKNFGAVDSFTPFRARFALLGQVCIVSARKRTLAAVCVVQKFPRRWRAYAFQGTLRIAWTSLHRFGPQMRPCRDLCRSKVPALLTVLHPSGHASHCLEGFAPFQPANTPSMAIFVVQKFPCRWRACALQHASHCLDAFGFASTCKHALAAYAVSRRARITWRVLRHSSMQTY